MSLDNNKRLAIVETKDAIQEQGFLECDAQDDLNQDQDMVDSSDEAEENDPKVD